jgi:hypothetical protein
LAGRRIGAEVVDNWAVRSLVSTFVEIYGARAGHEWAEIRDLCASYTAAKTAAESAAKNAARASASYRTKRSGPTRTETAVNADRLLDNLDAPLRDEWAIEAFLLMVHNWVNIGWLDVGSGRTPPAGWAAELASFLARQARAVTKRVAFEAYKHSSWSWPEEVE